MKLFSCYLEHLDSLGLRHANRLKSWVGGCSKENFKLFVLCNSAYLFVIYLVTHTDLGYLASDSMFIE
jgi:hypothetical protein